MLTYMAGKVYLVGIGTGSIQEITPKARQAVESASVVIGHSDSLRFIAEVTSHCEIVDGDMSPLERSALAVEYAGRGQKVAVVSSGDPGIFAIASTFFSYLMDNGLQVEVEVVPGITTASSAAARLGSPLGNDFAVVSLADQAGDWLETSKRLEAAAKADFVLVLYNPVGKLGQKRLLSVYAVLQESRSSCTPVGLVSGAGTPDETTRIITLGELPEVSVSPDCLIIAGNSKTCLYNGWMVTPRAYLPGLGY